MEVAGGELTTTVQSYHKVWLPARDIVKEALKDRKEVSVTMILHLYHLQVKT